MIIVTRCRTSGMKGHRDYKTWYEPLTVKADSIIAYGDQYIALTSGHRYEVAESMLEISNMIDTVTNKVNPAAIAEFNQFGSDASNADFVVEKF